MLPFLPMRDMLIYSDTPRATLCATSSCVFGVVDIGAVCSRIDSKKRIRWTDRVALQSQVGSAVDTLEIILAALKDNKTREDVGLPGDTRFTDEGIEALYEFAEIDVWSLRTNFFGRALDLGQFERFKTVMVLEPFAITLVGDYTILSVLSPSDDRVRIRVLFSKPRSDDVVFCVTMTRVAHGEAKSWRVESFLHDPEGSSPTAGDLPPEDT